MSRTYRRRDGYLPWWVTYTFPNSFLREGCRLTGDALKKSLNRYHSDAGEYERRGCNKAFRKAEQVKQRMWDKQELARWMKDGDHPVQCFLLPQDWWD